MRWSATVVSVDGDPGDSVLRSAMLAGVSALLTVVGHTAAGGSVPDLAMLVVLLPALAGLLTGLARHCRSVPATIAVLGAGQFVLHHFMELQHPGLHATAPLLPSGTQMLAMHAAITVAMAVALAHADRAVMSLRNAWSRVLPHRLSPLPADRPLPVLAVPGPAIPVRLARAHAVCHVRRGPPVGC